MQMTEILLGIYRIPFNTLHTCPFDKCFQITILLTRPTQINPTHVPTLREGSILIKDEKGQDGSKYYSI